MLPDLFYTINFSIALITAVISFIVSFLTIFIFITHRECRTVANLMPVNASIGLIFYFTIVSIESIYGLRGDWAQHQPACVFRAYCLAAGLAALSYSQLAQAISRLFFVVLYKYRWLLAWRVHWFMIIVNWLISMIIPILPFFFNGAYQLEEESRSCILTTKVFVTSMYVVIAMYIIPFSFIVVIYSSILYKTQQSTRRVAPVANKMILVVKTNNISVPNIKRERQLIKTMLILIGGLSCAGAPYLSLIIWHVLGLQSSPPPESLYLLSLNSMSISATFLGFIVVWLNKDLKKCIFAYFRILKNMVLISITANTSNEIIQ